MSLIYHITTRDAALNARQSGEYRAESLAGEGMIHFSQLHQILGVANAFYTGQKDLVILVADTSRLRAELKYEPPIHPTGSNSTPADDGLFPHLYGPLNFEAVIDVIDFPLGAHDKFLLPAEINKKM